MSIFLLHGIVDDWRPKTFTFRNYVDRHIFESYLASRQEPFAQWEPGLDQADVLTVDDATVAGAEACLLANRLGHKVIFFVNPFQIVSQQPYFFSLLDAALDRRHASIITVGHDTFELTTPAAVRSFRACVKNLLARRPADEALDMMKTIARSLTTDDASVPPFALPISTQDIEDLRSQGVQIECHGWSHVDIAALNEQEFSSHLSMGYDWLNQHTNLESLLYAVPFGLTEVPQAWHCHLRGEYFLADSTKPRGRLSARCWNREDLTTPLQRVFTL